MKLRLAKIGDFYSAYELICDMEATRLNRTQFRGIFESNLQDKQLRLLVAEDNDRVIGFLCLQIRPVLHHAGNIAEILEFAVEEHERCKGVGARLYAYAEGFANAADCIQMEVCCNVLRVRAHQFYERQGMNKYHYKLSKTLDGSTDKENRLGR